MWGIIWRQVLIHTIGRVFSELGDRLLAEVTKRKRDRVYSNWKRPRNLAVLTALSFTLCGCSVVQTVSDWYNGATEETVEAVSEAYDSTAEQAFIKNSPRLGGYAFPTDKEPTITIEEWKIDGKIVFSCPEFTNMKLPEHYGSCVITTDGNKTDDHMSGYMYHDSRWNKHYGDNLKSFIVVIYQDNGTIAAYSQVVTV